MGDYLGKECNQIILDKVLPDITLAISSYVKECLDAKYTEKVAEWTIWKAERIAGLLTDYVMAEAEKYNKIMIDKSISSF